MDSCGSCGRSDSDGYNIDIVLRQYSMHSAYFVFLL